MKFDFDKIMRAMGLVLIGAAVTLLLCPKAKADTRIGVHIASYHDPKMGYNNVNPGLYIYKDGWTAGTYYNSERRQSFYGGYTFEGELIGPVSWGLTVGLITGYSRAKVLPMVVPTLSIPDRILGGTVRVAFIPPVSKGAAAIHLSHEWRF